MAILGNTIISVIDQDSSSDWTSNWAVTTVLQTITASISWSGADLKGQLYIDLTNATVRSTGGSGDGLQTYSNILTPESAVQTIVINLADVPGTTTWAGRIESGFMLCRLRYVADTFAAGTGSINAIVFGQSWG